MRVVIAQGGGFYGSALFTTKHSADKLHLALRDEPGFTLHEDDIHLFYAPDTAVVIKEWGGLEQPNPVVLTDTGHAPIDMHILDHLAYLFQRPCMTNGNLEKNRKKNPN